MVERSPLFLATTEYFNQPSVAIRVPELEQLASELQTNRTRSSDDPNLEGLNPIPVGAGQDGKYIWSTLRGHLDSLGPEGDPRLQVLLSLNAPPDAPKQRLGETLDAVKTFAEENPDFPLSYYRKTYPRGTPIGTVRSDVLESGLLWSKRESGLLTPPARDDVAVVINDIDEIHRAAGYESLMLNRLAEPGVIAVRGLAEFEASGYRNIDGMLRWRTVPFRAGVSGCEFNYAISVRDVYLPAGGYDRSDTRGETVQTIRRAPLFQSREGTIETAEGAVITSSNRHLVEAALRGTPPWKIHMGLGVGEASYREAERSDAGRDFTDAEYDAAIQDYQRDILIQGGPIAYMREGRSGVDKLVEAIKTAHQEWGGGLLADSEIDQLVLQVLAKSEQ